VPRRAWAQIGTRARRRGCQATSSGYSFLSTWLRPFLGGARRMATGARRVHLVTSTTSTCWRGQCCGRNRRTATSSRPGCVTRPSPSSGGRPRARSGSSAALSGAGPRSRHLTCPSRLLSTSFAGLDESSRCGRYVRVRIDRRDTHRERHRHSVHHPGRKRVRPDGSGGTSTGGWAFRHGPETVAGDKFRLGSGWTTGSCCWGVRPGSCSRGSGPDAATRSPRG
jgi:hypothetical protein